MMRSSSLSLFGAVGLIVMTASGCRVEAHTQTQFEDSTQPAKTSTRDYAGEPITIENDGINPLSGTGGVEVKVDPTATRITVAAVFAAYADDDKKSDADASIRDAIGTMVIDEGANAITIRCKHGKPHGSSSEAGSGCKILRVTIPGGSVAAPLDLTVGNGNGAIRVGLAEAGDAPYVRNFTVDNNGLGDVDVRVRPVKDSALQITGERAVSVALPGDFSTKSVAFTVTDEDDNAKRLARLVLTDFPGMQGGSPYPTSGATADAAASLNVTTNGPFDDDTITVKKF